MVREVSIELDNKTKYILADVLYLEDIIEGKLVYSAYPTEDRKTEFEKLDDREKQEKQNKLIVDLAKQLIQKSGLENVKVLDISPFSMRVIGKDIPKSWGINVAYQKDSEIYQACFNLVGTIDELSIKGEIDRSPSPSYLKFLKKGSV
jgi:hypothetical protein